MRDKKSHEGLDHETRIGTTNAEFGAGRPRLIFKIGSDHSHDSPHREFDLIDPITTIGSGSDMHLILEGLSNFHAEIRHDEHDEYVLYIRDSVDSVTEPASPMGEGAQTGRRVLRTGAPVELGNWAMSFYREEFADHGRPFGGRQGGEGATQLDQEGHPTME